MLEPVRHIEYTRRRGFTLLEMLIAISVSSLVVPVVLFLMLQTARDQRQAFVEQRVFQHADRLQDRLQEIFRGSHQSNNQIFYPGASRQAGILMTAADGMFFNIVRFYADDPTLATVPQQQVAYDGTTRELVYDPNLAVGGNEQIINLAEGPEAITSLDWVRFRVAQKDGGIPDSSLILVDFQVSDHGYAKRVTHDPNDPVNWIISHRTFAINLRRE